MITPAEDFTLPLIWDSIKIAFRRLTPWAQFRNPILFITYLGALLILVLVFLEWQRGQFSNFNFQILIWLFCTVFFSNLALCLAEARGKAQAANLRKKQIETTARVLRDGEYIKIPAVQLKKGDIVVCETADIIPADGEIIEGMATIDESAITGESAPVIRECGPDRGAVTSGTQVVNDRIVIRVTSEEGHSFLDRMTQLIEVAKLDKSPNQIALTSFLSMLALTMLVVIVSLKVFSFYAVEAGGIPVFDFLTVPVLTVLYVCLLPTTIGALLNTVEIAGIDRLIRHNVIPKNGSALEGAGDIDTLILDKTGTLTLGNRMATAFLPAEGNTEKFVAEVAQLASFSDETPEGRSIVVLAKNLFDLRGDEVKTQAYQFIPFTPQRRMSGVDILDSSGNVLKAIRKGAVEAIVAHVMQKGGTLSPHVESIVQSIARRGGTPLLVSIDDKVVGVIHLRDFLKGGIRRRFAKLRKMGIHTLMVTGDNSLTASTIAAEAGVDDFMAEATPEMKLALIRKEQQRGRVVAMTGDGTNDAPALAQAEVGVAMNTGSQATQEAGNFVDLDSNPTKLIEIIEISKQLLMTRGALLTFSMGSNVVQHFALIPAAFAYLYPLEAGGKGPMSDPFGLYSPQSAILSTVIFNALVILILTPLSLRGRAYKEETSDELLRNNILIYGLGGFIVPFTCIKLLDYLIVYLGWVQ